MTDKNSLIIRTISSFFLLVFFFVMIFTNKLTFLMLTQILLFLANWELLRLISFKENNTIETKNTNFLLSRCQISKYDFILIFLINIFTLLFYFSYEKLQIIIVTLFILSFYKFSEKNYVKLLTLLYTSSAFIFLNDLSLDIKFLNYILFVIFFSMLVDVSAYFVGKTIGGPKIISTVSPNKTIAGCIGGILIPTFFCIIIFFKNNDISNIIFLSFLLSIISQIGDLLESAFKRYCFVKDSSSLIPGHGGILDRLDSILILIIFVSILKLFDYNFFFIV